MLWQLTVEVTTGPTSRAGLCTSMGIEASRGGEDLVPNPGQVASGAGCLTTGGDGR